MSRVARRVRDVDALGRELTRLGRLARAMPPMWRGGAIDLPVHATSGARVGRVLPGVGVYVDWDPREVGLAREIPNVFHRSAFLRAFDRVRDDRGVLTTMRNVVANWPIFGQTIQFGKSLSNLGGGWADWFQAWDVTFSGGGTYAAASTGGAAKDNTDASSFIYGARDPSGGRTAYLAQVGTYVDSSDAGSPSPDGGINFMLLYDLLWAGGAIDMSSTLVQTINSAALTRYTDGAGVCWAGIGVAPVFGSTSVAFTATLSYTNQAGVAGQTIVVDSPGESPGSFMFYLDASLSDQTPLCPFAAGDYGMRAIASVQLSAGAGVLGDQFALVMLRPLAVLVGGSVTLAYFEEGVADRAAFLTPLATTAGGTLGCLSMLGYSAASVSPLVCGNIGIVEG